jgi:ABC-type antimicrobial peptide transport system permease subunit
MTFVVHGTLPAAELVATARRAALELDPDLVILEAKTMNEHLALLLFAPRMAAGLLTVFGALALLLATIGLYGMVSYAVARRTREVGIRAALGASRTDIVRLMTAGGMRLIGIGIGVGLALAAGVSWLLSGFLYGIRATDAATFVAVPAVLAIVGFIAAWVPARRAAAVDPITALRTE